MENRLVQQLRTSHPNASVETVEVSKSTETSTQPQISEGLPNTEVNHAKTYASVVRRVLVDAKSGQEMDVNLPGPTPIPAKRSLKGRKPITKTNGRVGKLRRPKKKTSTQKKPQPQTNGILGAVSDVTKILDILCPEAAVCVRKLVDSLKPLLGMLGKLMDR